MRDILGTLLRWWRSGQPAGLATVTATWSSAPRGPGAAMAVGPDGTAAGSVSGGCVESEVYEMCRAAAESGAARTARFGVSDDDAYRAGLPCGGTVGLLIEPVGRDTFPELPELAAAVAAGRPAALATLLPGDQDRVRHLVVTPGGRSGTLGGDRIDDAVTADARDLLAAGRTALVRHDGREVLVRAFAPPARMLVFGATDHAAAVARIGSFLGFRVTVCDARPVFATAERFPDADEVVTDWPHRYLAAEADAGRLDDRTVICLLTHDARFDVPALELALRLPVAYVGAMGSRRTHAVRRERLRATGVDDAALDRLASPVGLDLGARTPAETAVSVAAEIVALRRGGSGRRLADTDGPLHP